MLLNLGCGATRPRDYPWVNVDTLYSILTGPDDAAARAALEREENYTDWDLANIPWPWPDQCSEGILASHFFEHLDAVSMQHVLKECVRILVPNGVLRISVPDPKYFRDMQPLDDASHAVEIFGEELKDPNCSTFMAWALFFAGHQQILSEDALWCHLVNAGFKPYNVVRSAGGIGVRPGHPWAKTIAQYDNRSKFSLYMEAYR